MATFAFRGKDEKGASVSGKVEARDQKEALSLLRERNLFVINLKLRGENPLVALRRQFRRISFSDTVNFTSQLSTMFSAGLGLTETLRILEAQLDNPAMKSIVSEIGREVDGGSSLSAALEKHPCFSKIYASVVRAGEASGMLDKVLSRLAENLEKERNLRSKLKGALIYPTIILMAMGVVVAIMMIVVMPKMSAMYKEFGAQLPQTTRLLIAFSDFFAKFWWVFFAGLFGLYFLYSSWKRTPFGKRRNDEIILKIPIVGNLKKQTLLGEFARTLGLLIGAGVPLLDGLNIVSGAVDSHPYKQSIKEMSKEVEKGYPLSLVIGQDPLFPPLLAQMVKVGEETGKIDETLTKVSSYFETASEEAVKGLTTAIEPLIMIILGLGVGFLVIAVIMPIYSLTSKF